MAKAPAKNTKKKSFKKKEKKSVSSGIVYVQASFNNTIVTFTDQTGNVLAWSSSGALGFKGAKKGTPFAATKIGELLGEKAEQAGIKTLDVVVKGVGSGRESAVRAMMAFNIEILSIVDKTPVPHNGPKPRKPRHV